MNKISISIVTTLVKPPLRWRITLAILLLFCFCSSGLAADVKANNRAREERLRVFDEVWETIRERYYDQNLRGVDWQAQRENYRSKAALVNNSIEFYRILRSMIGALNDSHTRVYAPEEKSDWRNPRFVSVGVAVREIENEIIVTSVEKNSLAEKANLKVGDTIIEINNVSTNQVFARRIIEQTGASTAAAARLRAAAGIFEGAAGTKIEFKFKNRTGRIRRAELLREWRNLPATLKTRRADGILIVSFDAFVPETVREFFQTLNLNLRGARGVVLDLRQNRGGSAEAMIDIASAFLPEDQLFGKFIDRAGKTVIETRTRRHLLYTASSTKALTVPVVVLTATATASAAEIFAAALKERNRARIIGAPTCGCVLAVKGQHALPDGGALEISEFDFQLASGSRLEGAGVAPDDTILPTHKDLLNNRDRALERALELLK